MRRGRPWLWGASLGLLVGVGSTVATADEVIILGAPVSLTGKYSQNGINTRNGYDLAVRKINEKGGISIGGKPHMLAIRYYDDESTRGTELARASFSPRATATSSPCCRPRSNISRPLSS